MFVYLTSRHYTFQSLLYLLCPEKLLITSMGIFSNSQHRTGGLKERQQLLATIPGSFFKPIVSQALRFS